MFRHLTKDPLKRHWKCFKMLISGLWPTKVDTVQQTLQSNLNFLKSTFGGEEPNSVIGQSTAIFLNFNLAKLCDTQGFSQQPHLPSVPTFVSQLSPPD